VPARGDHAEPGDGVEEIYPAMEEVDHVLVMSVVPGFSGQKFMPEVCQGRGGEGAAAGGPASGIDGGIHEQTIRRARTRGWTGSWSPARSSTRRTERRRSRGCGNNSDEQAFEKPTAAPWAFHRPRANTCHFFTTVVRRFIRGVMGIVAVLIEAGPTRWDVEDRLVGSASLPLTAEAMDAIGHLLNALTEPIEAVHRRRRTKRAGRRADHPKKFGIRARDNAELEEWGWLWQGLLPQDVRSGFRRCFRNGGGALQVTPPDGEPLRRRSSVWGRGEPDFSPQPQPLHRAGAAADGLQIAAGFCGASRRCRSRALASSPADRDD